MPYNIKDDLLKCNCKNSKFEHYYDPIKKTIIYFPNESFNLINYPEDNENQIYKRCRYFYNDKCKNNYCNNKKCNFYHIKDDEKPIFCNKINKYIINQNIYNYHKNDKNELGWNNSDSYNERNERRINFELNNYIIEEKKDIKLISNSVNSLKQLLNDESYLFEYKSSAPEYSPNYNIPKYFESSVPEYSPNYNIPKYFESSVPQYSPNYNIPKYFDEKSNTELTVDSIPYSPTAPKYCNDTELYRYKKRKLYDVVEEQPSLTVDSEWFENRSRKIKINDKGVIYYIKKITGEKSWIHPYTGKTNLPGGCLTPSDAGLI